VRIVITMDLDHYFEDPDHEMGISEKGYDQLCEALGDFGTDINVERG
jgi:hypothetical protein